MVTSKTRFTPIRMIITQNEPVTLDVTVQNEGKEEELSSILVKLPPGLGFDQSCLSREKRERLDYIKPGESKTAMFRIHPKFNITPGDYEIIVETYTHPERYDKTISKKEHKTKLRVLE